MATASIKRGLCNPCQLCCRKIDDTRNRWNLGITSAECATVQLLWTDYVVYADSIAPPTIRHTKGLGHARLVYTEPGGWPRSHAFTISRGWRMALAERPGYVREWTHAFGGSPQGGPTIDNSEHFSSSSSSSTGSWPKNVDISRMVNGIAIRLAGMKALAVIKQQ